MLADRVLVRPFEQAVDLAVGVVVELDLPDGNRYVVFASKAGADTNPDWYHNLRAHPQAQIEVGDQTLDVEASEIKGPERDELYARQASRYPGFAAYQRKTTRVIPVVALIERSAG